MANYLPKRKRRASPKTRRRPLYIAMVGAIDLITQEKKKNPGSAREALNYEPGLIDGFRFIDGYEEFDGLARPSDATWYIVELSDATDRSVGETLTGNAGGSGYILLIVDPFVVITLFNGTSFVVDETTNGDGTVAVEEVEHDSLDDYEDNSLELLAQNYYRALIDVVAGAGDVLGVWRHQAKTVSFRNNVGESIAVPFLAHASTGWTELTLHTVVYFDAGTVAFVYDEAITSAGTGIGTVKKIIVTSGDWSSNDATGYLVINISSGTFANNELLTGGTAGSCTQDGASAAISFSPGGRFEFISNNFYADDDRYAIYGCDGVNEAFEIDSNNILTPIFTNSTPDTPKYLVAHKYHLVLAIGTSILISKVGEPYNFIAGQGTVEIAVGSNVSGLKIQPGDVLTVAAIRSTWGLYGETVDDFILKPISLDSGAVDYSFQTLGDPFGLDGRGVISQQRVTAYGNFEASTITRLIQPIIDAKRSLLVASSVLYKRNQIRLWFSDLTALVISISRAKGAMTARATTLKLDHQVTCICNAEDENGDERIFFGASDGSVYEMERGFSFDGANIESFLRTNYVNPLKSFRQTFNMYGVVFNIKTDSNFSVSISYEWSFSSPNIAPADTLLVTALGGGGYYDGDDEYDDFYYDAATVAEVQIPVLGYGESINFSLYNDSNIIKSFEIEGYTLDFSPRGMVRAY